MLVVAKDGSGDFSNISNALAWIQENQEKSERVIFIRSGIYEERVEIRTPYLTLIGGKCRNYGNYRTSVCEDADGRYRKTGNISYLYRVCRYT